MRSLVLATPAVNLTAITQAPPNARLARTLRTPEEAQLWARTFNEANRTNPSGLVAIVNPANPLEVLRCPVESEAAATDTSARRETLKRVNTKLEAAAQILDRLTRSTTEGGAN